MTGPGGRTGQYSTRTRLWRAAGRWIDMVRGFYGRPIAKLGLLVSAAFLTYGGGAVMFWFHAIVRGEAGPAIDNVHHWLLDSTLGFVALTPVLALILPVAVRHASGIGGSRSRVRLGVYVGATALAFTAFTGPGPLLHNTVAGAGTPLADLATRIFGENPEMLAHDMHVARSPLSEGLLQLAVGLPTYTLCVWLALALVRRSVRTARRRPLRRPGTATQTTARVPH